MDIRMSETGGALQVDREMGLFLSLLDAWLAEQRPTCTPRPICAARGSSGAQTLHHLCGHTAIFGTVVRATARVGQSKEKDQAWAVEGRGRREGLRRGPHASSCPSPVRSLRLSC